MHKPGNNWGLEQWLYDLENRNTQEIQLGLTRIREVAEKLHILNPECKIITVGGTNGKGSTVCALETIYFKAGYQVGSYSSPHLLHFNERIKINLEPVNDIDLCTFFKIIDEARGKIVLTYFEFITLAALLCFNQQKLDVIIVEVGLGGRLDATNIIDADLSIITTIDYDHQEYLGTTLEAIAYEKAGILRQGRPFIYADTCPPESILKVAQELGVKSYFYGRDFYFNEYTDSFELIVLKDKIKLDKPKIHLKSASAAVVACLLLQSKLPVAHNFIDEALRELFIPGRLQLIKGPINLLYDVSHNAQSAQLLAQYISGLKCAGRVHAIFSALKDKDILGIIYPLKDCVDLWYPAQLDNKRALNVDEMLHVFKEAKFDVSTSYTSPLTAFNTALSRAKSGDLIVVYGSFFTVSQVMAVQNNVLEQKESI